MLLKLVYSKDDSDSQQQEKSAAIILDPHDADDNIFNISCRPRLSVAIFYACSFICPFFVSFLSVFINLSETGRVSNVFANVEWLNISTEFWV